MDSGGRGGYVTYTDDAGPLRFAWEGASYGYEIMVPTAAEWEGLTGLPLAGRAEVLACIGRAIIAERGNASWSFRVVDKRFSRIEIHAA